jgi:hypothetical protein
MEGHRRAPSRDLTNSGRLIEGIKKSVRVRFEEHKMVFWVAPSLTFGHLLEECCLKWGLDTTRAVLIDPVDGKQWPQRAAVSEAMHALGRLKG